MNFYDHRFTIIIIVQKCSIENRKCF